MAQRKFDKADFDNLVENLITFLKSQKKFEDYNFEASGIRTLIDLLAYNTQYKLFYLNQVSSESFLDTAVLRHSVVSLAKHLGYTPRGARSSRATVNIKVETQSATPDPFIILTTDEIFQTSVDGKTYFLSPVKNHIAYFINQPDLSRAVTGRYEFNEVEIIEGKRLLHSFTVDTSLNRQRFIIPNSGVDETSLFVQVRESESSTVATTYKQHTNLLETDNESLIYFLQEIEDEKFELIFGDGVIGKALEDGNIVEVSYVVSSGDVISNASVFKAPNGVAGEPGVAVITVERATEAEEPESIESIRKLAPLWYESQNRAVTQSDYTTLLAKDIPDLEFLRVWGGENNDPPIYGVVFISAKPKDRLEYSTEEKEIILDTYVRQRNVISIEARFVDPEIIGLSLVTNVRYNSSVTSLQEDDIQAAVLTAIDNFRTTNLQGFDVDFRFSRLVKAIDNADPSILSSLTDIQLKARITPPFNVPTDYTINFNNQLDRGDVLNGVHSISSTGFLVGGIETFIQDDGKGNLEYYRIVNEERVVFKQNVGIVDYTNGLVCLTDLSVQSLPDGRTYLDIFAVPADEDVLAERNQIVVLEDEDIQVFVEKV
jgi:hypothetical protein